MAAGSAASESAGATVGADSAAAAEYARDAGRLLPIANVQRIMRSALPPGAKVSREAKECVQEAVSEFVAFVTSEASEKCMQAKRKTVNGSDLLWALGTLGFEEYVDVLNEHLATVREPQRRARPKSS